MTETDRAATSESQAERPQPKRPRRRLRRARWIGRIGAVVLRALGWTCRRDGRIAVQDDVIYALPHGRLLLGALVHRKRRIAIAVSTHGDGEMIAQAVERLGFHCLRGSTNRGGARVVLEYLRTCKDRPWALTPDGPRGPAFSVAPGIVALAARSGRPIVAVGIAARRAFYARSWDRCAIPWPFTKLCVRYSDPLQVPRTLDTAGQAEAIDRVTRAMAETTGRAQRAVRARGVPESQIFAQEPA